jgi:hypothetical protein
MIEIGPQLAETVQAGIGGVAVVAIAYFFFKWFQ